MRFFLLFTGLLVITGLFGQTIKVIDNSNLKPIENVAIFNLDHSKTALTNDQGTTGIPKFNEKDTLYFQHPSYQDFILPYKDAQKMGFEINLTKSTVNLSEYVVSASKWEQKREEVPNKITSIKVKEVEFLNPQTTADLLGSIQ